MEVVLLRLMFVQCKKAFISGSFFSRGNLGMPGPGAEGCQGRGAQGDRHRAGNRVVTFTQRPHCSSHPVSNRGKGWWAAAAEIVFQPAPPKVLANVSPVAFTLGQPQPTAISPRPGRGAGEGKQSLPGKECPRVFGKAR